MIYQVAVFNTEGHNKVENTQNAVIAEGSFIMHSDKKYDSDTVVELRVFSETIKRFLVVKRTAIKATKRVKAPESVYLFNDRIGEYFCKNVSSSCFASTPSIKNAPEFSLHAAKMANRIFRKRFGYYLKYVDENGNRITHAK